MNRLAVGRSARAQQAHKVDNRIDQLHKVDNRIGSEFCYAQDTHTHIHTHTEPQMVILGLPRASSGRQ